MKVALVHDWLTGMRGGERVLEALCELYPEADLFTLVYQKGSTNEVIEKRKIYPSLLQKFPQAQEKYRLYLPLLPVFAELMDLKKYDLVISSSHAVAKNVRVSSNATHISYVHSPIRYFWDMFDEYFDRYFGKYPQWIQKIANFTIKLGILPWRWWDVYTAKRVDYFVTNSEFVGQRVKEYYHRDYTVINPPVDVDAFIPSSDIKKGDYYIIVSALVPYKRVDLAIEAFNQLGKQLVVVGKGPSLEKLKSMAGDNISFKGFLPRDEVIDLMQKARGFIYPQIEDFGISAIEAQAAGTPIIAYRRGGATETVEEKVTGVFFDEQTPSALAEAVQRLEATEFNPNTLIDHAKKYRKEKFKDTFKTFVEQKISTG